MDGLRLFRRRLIPEETVELKDDEIVYVDEDKIITKWHTLKPRKDFSHGSSCYFLRCGYKVSAFLTAEGGLKYWYCDIIRSEFFKETNSWIFTDLLADVVVFESGETQVLDLDELAEAAKQELITSEELYLALRQLDALLHVIYQGKFGGYTEYLPK